MHKDIVKLKHYNDFKCIADKCNITCCQEWKISVDENAQKIWKELGYEKSVCENEGQKVIKLDDQRKCPYLSENKLCSIVINNGEDAIPKACDVFPRQISEYDNRTEYALVSCCPYVIDLMDKVEIKDLISDLNKKSFDKYYEIRKIFINVIANAKETKVGILQNFYMAKELLEQESFMVDSKFIKELEDAICAMETDEINTFEEVNELFLDITQNYIEKGMYKRYIDDVVSCAVDISNGYDEDKIKNSIRKFNEQMKAYDEVFKKYIISELFAELISPDCEDDEMLVMLQWLAMEFVIIRHALFLLYYSGKQKIEKKNIVEFMVIISRMMGYSKDDIFEYMEECFEEYIWDWGYMALIVM